MSKRSKRNTLAEVKTSMEATTAWNSGLKTAKFCGRCDLPKPKIQLIPRVHEKIMAISDEVAHLNIEWLGYLMGQLTEGVLIIDDIFVPKQEVGGASVKVLEAYSNERLLGTVHLHPFQNGAWFSSTDIDNIGENHTIMVVHDKAGTFKAQARHTLECGATMMVEADIEFDILPDPELQRFLADSLLNVTVKTTVYLGQYDADVTITTAKRWCGACRKLMTSTELGRMVDNVEVCTSCFTNNKKPFIVPATIYEGQRHCDLCTLPTPWAKLTWFSERKAWFCDDCKAYVDRTQDAQTVAMFNDAP